VGFQTNYSLTSHHGIMDGAGREIEPIARLEAELLPELG
jgi:hypothetical protein